MKYEIEKRDDSFEKYDVSEEDLNKIKSKKVHDNVKLMPYAFLIIFFIIIFVIIWAIPVIASKINKEKIKNQYKNEITESLGEIIEIEEPVNKQEEYQAGVTNGNLVQEITSNNENTNNTITMNDNQIFVANKNVITIYDKKTLEEITSLKIGTYPLSNLNITDTFLVCQSTEPSGMGTCFSIIHLIDLNNYMDTEWYINTKFIQDYSPTIIADHEGVTVTATAGLSINKIKFSNNRMEKYTDLNMSFSGYSKLLKLTETDIYYIDSSGIKVYNKEDKSNIVINNNITDITVQPIINDEENIYYKSKESIYKNDKIIYTQSENIDSINIYKNNILFLSENTVYMLVDNNAIKIKEFETDIDSLYVFDDLLVINSDEITVIKLKNYL